MPWFSRDKEKDPWEENGDSLVGDIDLAHKVRDICASAESSAEKLSVLVNRQNDKLKKSEFGRYDAAKRRALELAKLMSDELLRDTAVRQIVNLCMRANDVETAAVLIEAVQTEKVRQETLNDHPSLR